MSEDKYGLYMRKGYKLINQTIVICIDGMDND